MQASDAFNSVADTKDADEGVPLATMGPLMPTQYHSLEEEAPLCAGKLIGIVAV